MGNITAAAATGGEERPAAAVGERRGSDYAERYIPNRQSQTEHFGQLNEVSTTNYVVRWYRMLVRHLQRLRGVEVAEVSTEVNVGMGSVVLIRQSQDLWLNTSEVIEVFGWKG